MANDTYVPGVCNIGPAEIANRRLVGWTGTGLTIALFIFLVVVHVDQVWRLVLFLPLFLATIGFFQASLHFCVGYGLGGIYNVLKPFGNTETVEKAEFRSADRLKALAILGYSLAASLVITLVLTYGL